MKSKESLLKDILNTAEVYINRYKRVANIKVTTLQKTKQQARLMLILRIMASMSKVQYETILAQPKQ